MACLVGKMVAYRHCYDPPSSPTFRMPPLWFLNVHDMSNCSAFVKGIMTFVIAPDSALTNTEIGLIFPS